MFRKLFSFHKRGRKGEAGSSDTDILLRDKQQELDELMQDVAAGAPDIDLKIASMVEGEPEHVRIAIIEKIRDMLRQREEEKTRELEASHGRSRKQQVEAQRMSFRQWLTWIMSEDSLRRIRESFLARPIVELQVKNIGEELAKKGVMNQLQLMNANDLGELSATIAKHQAAQKAKDQLIR